nr:glycoside hydrolase family 2 TIM barrel-domain containing protein [Capillibacterium thermochitinicola]
MAKMDLGGIWELHPVAEFSRLWLSEEVPAEGWVQQEIPGQWQELKEFSGYAGKMVYRRNFRFTPEADRIYRLEIGGVFYKYRVYLNNYAIGGQEGYFYPSSYNITPYLREENQILLEVESPGKKGDGATVPVLTGIFTGHPVFPEGFNPGGIWRPVRILSSGPAFIEGWHLRTEELAEDVATLSLKLEVYAARPAEINVHLQLVPHNFDGQSYQQVFPLKLEKGTNQFATRFILHGVRPWQTWDRGQPCLYRTSLTLQALGETWDAQEMLFGIRTFTLQNMIPYLNGQRLLVKGSNYLPPALYLSKVEKDDYQREIDLLRQSHQNMVRCYQHIEKPEFYQAMDEAGILVWQDFPLPGGSTFNNLTNLLQQVEAAYNLLGNHPSVAIWTICNQSGFEALPPERPNVNFYRVVQKLAQRLAEIDPGRPVISVSGQGSFRTAVDTGFNFQYPEEIHRFDQYRRGAKQRRIRFVSWFGRAALGSAEPDEKTRVRSQKQQAETLRFYIDRLRFHKYKPTGGMLFFCFRSLDTGLSWSVVNGEGRPKEGFAMAALCYRPVYVFALLPREKYRTGTLLQAPICFSNDRIDSEQPPVLVKARLTDPRGQLVWKDQWTVQPRPDEETRILGEVSVMLMTKGVYRLNLQWLDQEETVENNYQINVV